MELDKAMPEARTTLPKESKASHRITSSAKKPAKKTNGLASGWGFLNGDRSFKETKKKRKSTSSSLDDASGGNSARNFIKKPYTGGDDLPILSHPQDMFDDMIHNQLCENGRRLDILQPLLEKLHGRTLKIATMCSGTESPVLALDMLAKSIEDLCQEYGITVGDKNSAPSIRLEHVFSCEIEPFKQSYIERNFAPKRLFRDIRELGNDKACTAFGALIDVPNTPGCVDLLVAGTSCVDYSNLNNSKKTMEEQGESGQTFQGMLNWIQKAQPSIIILENVYGAPWEEKVKLMESYGYASTFQRVDTKDFYIPQTRQRGYLFAVLKDGKQNVNRKRVQGWEAQLNKLKRPASAALDAFMLSNDDPRVLQGRARLTAESSVDGQSRAGRTDWSKCETKHQMARSDEELGEKRPFTAWAESQPTAAPGFAWNDWISAQVNRVHDLIDINTLRLAQCDVDNTYKSNIWNLSQNVDRDTMGTFNLSQCLTPSGIPYVTNRGGPLVGEELLLLQGIPADDLLLTKESESDLKDLAGNAMSTTVVGACIISALLQGHKTLRAQETSGDKATVGSIVSSLVPRPLVPASEVEISKSFGNYATTTIELGQPAATGKSYLSTLFAEGWLSSRKCVNEAPNEASPSILQCADCGQTTSKEAATPARKYEEHNFQPVNDMTRIHPPVYRRKLLNALPMVLKLENLNVLSLSKPEGVPEKLWSEWQKRVQQSVQSEFRFAELVRRHYWSAVFRSTAGSHLELRMYKTSAEWLLFVEAPHKRGALRDFLERPVARFPVSASSDSILGASCEVRLPLVTKMDLTVTPAGDQVPSWRQRLGLKGGYETETQPEKLRISLHTDDACMKEKIDGVYEYLPLCGGACGSMHMKTKPTSSDKEPVFFFFESSRGGIPQDDAYVFAHTPHRTSYGEHRETLLKIDPKAEFRPVSSNMKDPTSSKVIPALISGMWTELRTTSLQECSMNASCTVPKSALIVPVEEDGWKICPSLASFEVPLNKADDVLARCIRAGAPLDLNLRKSRSVFQQLSFVLSRVTIPQNVEEWSLMKNDNKIDFGCATCAPSKPGVRWQLVSAGTRTAYKPIEDWKEAAAYESLLKARPAPWNVRLESKSSKSLGVSIGLNAFSLCQRAFGLLPPLTAPRQEMICSRSTNESKSIFEWRVTPHAEKASASFSKLVFTSNKLDPESDQPPNFNKFKLRKEQLRSLSWMLQQERDTEPFMEEEVCESVLPTLEWRAEGRVRRPVMVRGGIIADEVGYGKTCITLACIDSNGETERRPKGPNDVGSGLLATKATLVVVPGHLMGQWPQEITKFMGNAKKVLTIKSMKSFNDTSVGDIMAADIIIVNFTVLNSEKYYTRLARLAGRNPKSIPSGKNGGRYFDAVYESCVEGISKRVSELKENCHDVFSSIEKDAEECRIRESKEEASFRLDGKKAVYKNTGKSTDKVGENRALDAKEVDPWNLRCQKDFTKMKCPPLELFHWRRIVVDEFTYLLDKADRQRPLSLVRRLSSEYRWFLSGTPQHETFDDIKCLANLLNVHLGIDEALPGAKLGKGNERTAAENMSQFLEVRSLQWHERRRAKAQDFLDRFVRQNIAEIDEIPSEEAEIMVALSPIERAIYLELETFLRSLEMNAQSAKMSKKKSTSDRESRMQKVLEDSTTAEEALLKCCCHFSPCSGESTTPMKTCEDIIAFRKDQKKELELEIVASIAAAIRQQDRIENEQPGWMQIKEHQNIKGELTNAVGRFLEAVRTSTSILHGADNTTHELQKELLAIAVKEADQHPDQDDPVFADVNERLAEIKAEEEGGKPGKKRKTSTESSKPEENGSRKEIMFAMKKSLRDHMHRVNALGKELCGRVRSLRYIESMRGLQKKTVTIRCQCQGCRGKEVEISDAGILSTCGHVGSLRCLKEHAANGNCVEVTCKARVNVAHVVSASDLGTDQDDSMNNADGSKLSAIISKVNEVIASGDRMIIFVQFDDLKDTIAQVLSRNGIDAVQLKGRVDDQVKALLPFQSDTPKAGDPRVLLLKMDDEQSAGLNLTNLNHVLFAHPLLAETQQQYDAYETQSIGRIRRYGQQKTVFVWRFLVSDSIDTAIYDKRGGRSLAATTVNQM